MGHPRPAKARAHPCPIGPKPTMPTGRPPISTAPRVATSDCGQRPGPQFRLAPRQHPADGKRRAERPFDHRGGVEPGDVAKRDPGGGQRVTRREIGHRRSAAARTPGAAARLRRRRRDPACRAASPQRIELDPRPVVLPQLTDRCRRRIAATGRCLQAAPAAWSTGRGASDSRVQGADAALGSTCAEFDTPSPPELCVIPARLPLAA